MITSLLLVIDLLILFIQLAVYFQDPNATSMFYVFSKRVWMGFTD